MTRHEPERAAARFLGGDMGTREHHDHSAHLLDCRLCRDEVTQGRRGRAAAESARVAAPGALRDRVRALVELEDLERASGTPDGRRAGWLAATVVLVVLGVVLGISLGRPRGLGGAAGTAEPPSVRAAIAGFRTEQLPGRHLATAAAPDLSGLHLAPVGAGGGAYAGLPVDGYAYRDAVGRRIVVYLSPQPFPEAPGARHLTGSAGPWIAVRGDVIVLCAGLPRAVLVLGQDEALVRGTAGVLGVL